MRSLRSLFPEGLSFAVAAVASAHSCARSQCTVHLSGAPRVRCEAWRHAPFAGGAGSGELLLSAPPGDNKCEDC